MFLFHSLCVVGARRVIERVKNFIVPVSSHMFALEKKEKKNQIISTENSDNNRKDNETRFEKLTD